MIYTQFKGNGDGTMLPGITHISGMPGWPDFTLCGVTLDHDEVTAGHHFEVPPRKITCQKCAMLIKFCRDKAIKI